MKKVDYKHEMLDKYDSHRAANKPSWLQGQYHCSGWSNYFHLSTAYIGFEDGTGSRAGVNKKEFKASGSGYYMDAHSIGKSEEK